jgi:microcystin-dependent protein
LRAANGALMPSQFVGEIRIFAGNFAPTGWAFCNGQLLPISQNTALFSILGTAYGGNGLSTFALPDLRGRVPMQPGQGLGLTPRSRGDSPGTETHTLILPELPAHTHPLGASSSNGTSDAPAGGVMARSPAAIPQYAAGFDTGMAIDAVSIAGGSQPHNNMQPFLTVNFIIALQGIYPPRWP